MKITHCNTHDITGGAAQAVNRLNTGLLDLDVNSHVCVQYKKTDYYTMHGPVSPIAKFFGFIKPFKLPWGIKCQNK